MYGSDDGGDGGCGEACLSRIADVKDLDLAWNEAFRWSKCSEYVVECLPASHEDKCLTGWGDGASEVSVKAGDVRFYATDADSSYGKFARG